MWREQFKKNQYRNFRGAYQEPKMVIFSEARLTCRFSHAVPGHAGVTLTRDPPDWSKAHVSVIPLPPFNPIEVNAAWNAEAPTLVAIAELESSP